MITVGEEILIYIFEQCVHVNTLLTCVMTDDVMS